MKEQIIAVQNMQDYIKEHLNEDITLTDLAYASMFSPWHSYRLFKEYTNYSPADYIRKYRLSVSAMKLKDENCKIVDIAYEMGFQSVDGYQRAFRREFGCNPKEYAKNPIPIYLFTPYGVIYSQILRDHVQVKEIKKVYVTTIVKPSRKVIIKRGIKAADYIEYCSEVGCEVWGLLTSMDTISGEPVCLWLPEAYRTTDSSEYVQGVEVAVDYDGVIPEGFDVITLPEAEYMVFRGDPFEEKDYCEAIEGVQEAIKHYNPTPDGYEWEHSNPVIQLEPIGKRGYIELHPVRKADK